MPAAVQFTSSMECTDDNYGAADTENKMDDIHKMLENDFWADSSDDEGIGSDESLDLSDQSSSDGTSSLKKSQSDLDKNFAKCPSSEAENDFKSLKRSISVINIGKILTRSIKHKEKSYFPSISQIESRKVFGVDLIEHLEKTSAVVPGILEFCSETIEENGVTDGVYRLSGQSCLIRTLKDIFEVGKVPDKVSEKDIHSVASLLKVRIFS